MNYTKKEIDDLLSLNSSWSLEKKQKTIRRLHRKFNAQIDTANTQNQIDHAEKMMDVCAQAIEIYKPKPHKRNYKKTTTKKKTKTIKKKTTTKKKTKKSGDSEGWGSVILFILFLLLISNC